MTESEKLEQRIGAIEARLDAAEKSLRLLAEDWRKQRAVNEALLAWINIDKDGYEGPALTSDDLIAALREAIK